MSIALRVNSKSLPRALALEARFLFWWSTLLIFLALTWPRSGFVSLGGLRVTPFTLAAGLSWPILIALSISSPLVRSGIRSGLRGKATIVWLLLFWIFWRYFSSFFGEDRADSFTKITREVVFMGILLPLTAFLMSRPNGKVIFFKTIIIAASVVSLVGVIEHFKELDFGQLLGIQFSQADGTTAPRLRGDDFRSQSTFSHPIVFGQFLVWILLPLWLYFRTGPSLLFRMLALANVAFAPILMYFTYSRGALIAMPLSVIAYYILRTLQRLRMSFAGKLVAAFVITAVGVFIMYAFSEPVLDLIRGRNSIEMQSSALRTMMFETGLDSAYKSPLIGYGDGQSVYHAGSSLGENGSLSIDSAYLSGLLDGGFVGLLLQLLAWGSIFAIAASAALKPEAKRMDCAVASAALAVLIVFSIVSIPDSISLLLMLVPLISATRPQPQRRRSQW